MAGRLEGKVAAITGAASGFGAGAAQRFIEEGAKVVVNYYNSSTDKDATLDAIKAVGGEAIALRCDVTKKEEIDKMVDQTKKAFGSKVDILINNAGGLFARKTIEEID